MPWQRKPAARSLVACSVSSMIHRTLTVAAALLASAAIHCGSDSPAPSAPDATSAGAAGAAGASSGGGDGQGGGAGGAGAAGASGGPSQPLCAPGAGCELGLQCSLLDGASKRTCSCEADGRLACSEAPGGCAVTAPATYLSPSLGCTGQCACEAPGASPVCSYACGEGQGCSEGAPCGPEVNGKCTVTSPSYSVSCTCEGSADGPPKLRCISPNTTCQGGSWCTGNKTCTGTTPAGCETKCSCNGASYACETTCPFCPAQPPSCGEPCGVEAYGKTCQCSGSSGTCACEGSEGEPPTWRCCQGFAKQGQPCGGLPDGFHCAAGTEGACVCAGGVWSNCSF
jgi:hypothetical protein